MTCAACASRVERAVMKVPGVSSCAVSLLTNSMGVEGNAGADEIISAVKDAGYGAEESVKNKGKNLESETESLLKDRETPALAKRLFLSLVFLVALMYMGMGQSMWNFPLPEWLFQNGKNHLAVALLQMILSLVVIAINRKFFSSGFRAILKKNPNMDSLVALGSGFSFSYSVFSLFEMTDAVFRGNTVRAEELSMNLYFEGAAMIVSLITVGKLLESVSKGRTTNALKSLVKLSPKTASVIVLGKETEVPIEDVKVGDIFTVRPGQSVPVDGTIIEGRTSINESALTGESIPVEKTEGSDVSAATMNQSGFIKCRATRVGEDTTISQIIKMVSDAAATKAPIAKIADRVSGIFVPVVMVLSAATFFTWLMLGENMAFALNRAISVLVVSCPCALGLATPVAIMVSNGIGAKHGILFKTSESLELAGRIRTVVLDKTGTITRGEPQVTDVIPFEGSVEDLVAAAASLEEKSEHPLASAILKKAEEMNVQKKNAEEFNTFAGNGVSAVIDGKLVLGGNLQFIQEKLSESIDEKNLKAAEELSEQGKTPLFFASDKKFLGMIAVADVIREESPRAVRELQKMGLQVVMLTGDNEKTANALGKIAGVDRVVSNVLPDGKEKFVRELQKNGKVCMVGDGINDAPALTSADIGMAIGAGTDVALDAADIVLVKSLLTDVAAAIRLGRMTLTNIRENLFWAFFYNIALIPVAAGAYYRTFGLSMNPMLAAAAMSLSSVCVVANALRLNLFHMGNTRHKDGVKNKTDSKEHDMAAEKTFKVEGMMCANCERHVRESLEKIDGVLSAAASHQTKTATVVISREIAELEFEKAVTDAGYTFVR